VWKARPKKPRWRHCRSVVVVVVAAVVVVVVVVVVVAGW
jgi:hypothetical protein